MQTLGIEQLSFSLYRQIGAVPKASHDTLRRVQTHGFVEPVVVRPATTEGMFDVLSNPEVVLAANRLGILEVPVLVRDDLDDPQASAIVRDQHTATAGNPIDEAEWFQERLTEIGEGDGASKAKLARFTGTTRSRVSRSLSLLALPADVQNFLRAGSLTAGHGHLLVPLKEASLQLQFAREAVRDALTVRQLGHQLKQRQTDTADMQPVSAPVKDADTLRIEETISELIGMPFSIDLADGRVVIDYCGRMEVLDSLLQRLGYGDEFG